MIFPDALKDFKMDVQAQGEQEAHFDARYAVRLMLYVASLFLFGSAMLMAEQSIADTTERWIAPITMAAANLLGSIFAFLTAREIRRDDADKKIQKAELVRATDENTRCQEDRRKLDEQVVRLTKLMDRLKRRLRIDDESDEESGQSSRGGEPDRRGEADPDYKGPRRRKDDKGTKSHNPLPPEPSNEEEED